jgi:hypothetical protein
MKEDTWQRREAVAPRAEQAREPARPLASPSSGHGEALHTGRAANRCVLRVTSAATVSYT